MKKCSSCGQSNPDSAKFCRKCGDLLPNTEAGTVMGAEQPEAVADEGAGQPATGEVTEPGTNNSQVSGNGTGTNGGKRKPVIAAVVAVLVIIAVAFFAFRGTEDDTESENGSEENTEESTNDDIDAVVEAQYVGLIEEGEELLEAEDYESAVETYTAAIEMKPEEVTPYRKLISAYTALGKTDEVRETYETVTAVISQNYQEEQVLIDDSVDVYIEAIVYYGGQGDTDQMDSCVAEIVNMLEKEDASAGGDSDSADKETDMDDSTENDSEDGGSETGGTDSNTDEDSDSDDDQDISDLIDEIRSLQTSWGYYNKLIEMQKTYGEAQLERTSTEYWDYIEYIYFWTGLCFAYLQDLDGDGQEELITGYYEPEKADTSDSYSQITTPYTIEVWAYVENELQMLWSQNAYHSSDYDSGCQIVTAGGSDYLVNGWYSGDGGYEEYYTCADGAISLAHTIDIFGESSGYTFDGETFSDDEYEAFSEAVNAWYDQIEETNYWYFANTYGLQEDISYFEDQYEEEMAPAKKELEEVFAELEERLKTEDDEEQEKETDSYTDMYADILEVFYNGIATQWEGYDSSEDPDAISYMWYFYNLAESLSDAGYALMDLDGNGIPELLVTEAEPANTGYIVDLYTYQNGEIVHLAESGERYGYYLCTDGTVEESWTGSAYDNGITWWSISEDSDELIVKENLYYVYSDDDSDPTIYYSTGTVSDTEQMTVISADEAQSVTDSYEYEDYEITLFSDYAASGSSSGDADEDSSDDTASSSDGGSSSGEESASESSAASSPVITQALATSALSEYGMTHSASLAIDGDTTTGWVEGADGQGTGESLMLTLAETSTVSGMTIYAGYQKTDELYLKNSRPKGLTITFSDGTVMSCELEDVNGGQTVNFPDAVTTGSVTLTITSVYEGNTYEDTVISEVSFF